MDKTIRLNQHCVVGLPRCDFAFSSTRSCFIAYGFKESPLEMGLLRQILDKRNIQTIEAGGTLAPGQNAFCAKICSKIITAQFCAVILNNDRVGRIDVPNANVNMEYGLMLGFNKYVIPFQRANQTLPFNVAGIDTIKYTNADFERRAAEAVDQAIAATTQESSSSSLPIDQTLEAFVIVRKRLFSTDPNNQSIFYQIGAGVGFYPLTDFSYLNYTFLGNFTNLRTEAIILRVRLLDEILEEHRKALPARVAAGFVTPQASLQLESTFNRAVIWTVVSSQSDKSTVEHILNSSLPTHMIEVYTIEAIQEELKAIRG